MTSPGTSAARLREMLAGDRATMRMYQTEALYHAQVDFTCQLLDVVDEVTDGVTAQRVTDAVCERLAGAGAVAAAERASAFEAETRHLAGGLSVSRLNHG